MQLQRLPNEKSVSGLNLIDVHIPHPIEPIPVLNYDHMNLIDCQPDPNK